MIEAKIVADSVSPNGKRITTIQVRLHRFILAELDTHRAFSRSFSSSRAIPTAKMIEQVRNNPAMPVWWGKNQAGMQAKEELDPITKAGAINQWKLAAENAAFMAESLAAIGAHKQLVNRIVEAFVWCNGIVTSTEWDNFFALRCHPDAQPEFQALACAMRDAMAASTPRPLLEGEWHLPYVTDEEREIWAPGMNRVTGGDAYFPQKISAARCCRVSYNKHDGTAPDCLEDIDLFEKLAGSVPIHASPLEHQATPLSHGIKQHVDGRNFRGWAQFRAVWEREHFSSDK